MWAELPGCLLDAHFFRHRHLETAGRDFSKNFPVIIYEADSHLGREADDPIYYRRMSETSCPHRTFLRPFRHSRIKSEIVAKTQHKGISSLYCGIRSCIENRRLRICTPTKEDKMKVDTGHMVIHTEPEGAVCLMAAIKPSKSVACVISETVDRYLEVIRQSIPDLDGPEWVIVFDALGDKWLADESHAGRLVAKVIESVDLRMDDYNVSIYRDHIARTLFQQPFAGLMAVMELNQIFWSRGGTGVEELQEAVESDGADILLYAEYEKQYSQNQPTCLYYNDGSRRCT